MKWWPWVSRERLEEAQQRIIALDAERQELLRVVMRGYQRGPAAAPVEDDGVVPYRETPKNNEPPAAPIISPFDRIEGRMDRDLKAGRVPARFRAKVS